MAVILELIEDRVAVIRIERPEVRNALDWKAMQDFRSRIEEAHALRDLCALIVTGSDKTFIAGGDLKALHKYTSQEDGQRLSKVMSTTLNRLESLPCQTIAAINGPARGGGAEISLATDLRIMSTDADLGFVQIELGLVPGWGAGQRLMRLVGYSRALELLTTGCILSAEQALSYGLINTLTLPGEAQDKAIELGRDIAAHPIDAVRAIKRMLRGGLYLPPTTANFMEQSEFPPLWASEEHNRAVQRFFERKKQI